MNISSVWCLEWRQGAKKSLGNKSEHQSQGRSAATALQKMAVWIRQAAGKDHSDKGEDNINSQTIPLVSVTSGGISLISLMENSKILVRRWLDWCSDCQGTMISPPLSRKNSPSLPLDKGMFYWAAFPSFMSMGYETACLDPCASATFSSVIVSDATGFS